MSYVPPHKRPENAAVRAASVPPSLLTKHNRNLGSIKNTKKIYADDYISKWFLVGSQENNNYRLVVPASSDPVEWRKGAEEKPLLILVMTSDFKKLETPWLCVAEKVENDLILGFGRAKKTLLRYGSEDVNLRLIARFGKVVFNGVESIRDVPLTKSKLEKQKKYFNTNVSKSYVENIVYGVVPKMGLCVEETKELYHVKAELNALRHLILDVSCLDQDLDLRLGVDSKNTITKNLSENEMNNLKELTDSAVLDPNVKGGLRWPLGKSSCADRYSVCGVWHTVTTTYRSSTLRLQVREADRYDVRTGIGRSTREVSLKLNALRKLLKEEEVEKGCVSDMLKDCLRAVCEYFLKAK
ncbi:unnamed protein product [Microthlaspi erraticum]|uniref:DUF7903 domain-containing protein n=1 Tax=Microthlaspi erraticum TaxID=1685480 RepID=A0A6D2K1Q3_9BRAS|nr:unnamed protein product [Microthlaspi erraticum]CAA7058787.1 unnamed protein product [Microthlaspi erraticum]